MGKSQVTGSAEIQGGCSGNQGGGLREPVRGFREPEGRDLSRDQGHQLPGEEDGRDKGSEMAREVRSMWKQGT